MTTDYIYAVFALWVLGFIAKQMSPDQAKDPKSLANVALLPWTVGSMYAAGEHESRRDRVLAVAVFAIVWVLAVAIASGMVHEFRAGNLPGSCPAGQHLEGGQGGGEQSCEYDRCRSARHTPYLFPTRHGLGSRVAPRGRMRANERRRDQR